MTAIRGVIVDMDGTLIDSNDAHAEAWVEAMQYYGFRVDFSRIRPLIGMGGDNLLPTAIGVDADSDLGKQISKYRGEQFQRNHLPTLKAFPQARALVQHMKDAGLKVIIGSSADKDELKSLLKLADVQDLVEGVTSSDDAKKSKPDPDIVAASLNRLGMPPEEVIMLGDTRFDIEAAAKAGVRTVALRCGGQPDSELSGALAIYGSPADLLAHFEESPLNVA